ncbi:MAG: hypothetical protein M0R66_09995 [Candidatus Omnitrophica bacterium]|nr:hypothetical protein [Candidatus Omnitrophota bacterium]
MRKIIALFITIIFLGGCASAPMRTNSQFASYFHEPGVEKTITVMPIDIKFYKLTAGGVSEQMDEWDIQSDALFRQAIIDRLDPSARIKVTVLEDKDIGSEFKKFLDEENGLYRAVSTSIINHTFTPYNAFPQKVKEFDYTLGPDLNNFTKFKDADALLFLSGSRTYWTGGRVALAAWGIALGAVTGVAVTPGSVLDWVSTALVDVKTGNVLWFKYVSKVGDLRNKGAVRSTVNYLFSDLDTKK